MLATSASQLNPQTQAPLVDRLAADGWIEKVSANGSRDADVWVAAHDVLADEIVLSYTRSIPQTVEGFVSELLTRACHTNCLDSTLFTLQRLIEYPLLRSVDWPEILDRKIVEECAAWRCVRDLLIRTSLLTAAQIMGLLREHEDFWEGAEKETEFQNALGWLCRWAVIQEKSSLDSLSRSTLVHWVKKCVPYAVRSNYILTWGLRLCPEAVRIPARQWILTRPTLLQTHYVFVAWLESGLPPLEIASAVVQWVEKFRTDPHLTFVYRAWLDAEGDKTLVQEPMESWLREHATSPAAGFVLKGWLNARGDIVEVRNFVETWLEGNNTELDAQFVYRAWLEAGGDKGIVQQPLEGWLREHATAPEAGFVLKGWLDAGYGPNMVENALIVWLSKHGTDTDADFVYKAWLAAGGAFSVVRSPAITWMHQNHEKWGACYIAKFLAKQPDLSDETVTDILTWCRNFCKDSDALWRLRQLGVHLLREEVAEEVCTTSEAVLTPLISGDAPLRPQVVGLITNVFSYLINAPKLKWTNLRSRVDALLLIWLRNPFSFPISPRPHITVQQASFVERIGDFIAAGAIDVMTDREPLRRFLTWVNSWRGDRKLSVYTTLVSLRQKYPVSDLWDIVDFD